jgi:hypothetical protein
MLEVRQLVDFILDIEDVVLEFNEDKTRLTFSRKGELLIPFEFDEGEVEFILQSFEVNGSRPTLKELFVIGVKNNIMIRLALQRLFIELTKPKTIVDSEGVMKGSVAFNTGSGKYVVITLDSAYGEHVHYLSRVELMTQLRKFKRFLK